MGAWMARWRAALRIARRDARRHTGRTVMVVLMLALPVAAMVLIAFLQQSFYPNDATFVRQNLGDGLQARISAVGCQTHQDIRASDSSCREGGQLKAVSTTDLAAILPAGDTIEPASQSDPTFLFKGQTAMWSVTAVGPTTLAALAKPTSGHLPQAAGEIALPANLADQLQASVGDRVTLSYGDRDRQKVKVTAILPVQSDIWASGGALMLNTAPTDPVDLAYLAGPDPVPWPLVQKLNGIGYQAISREVLTNPPADAPPAPGPYANYSLGSALPLTAMAVAGIEVVMIIGPAFAVGARRSRRQLATVAISGGSAADLRRIVRAGGILQGLAGGVIGGLLGIAAGLVLAATLCRGEIANIVLPWGEWALAVVLTTVLGVCAAWLPSRAAGKADPLAAMTGAPPAPATRGRAWVAPAIAVAAAGAGIYALVEHQPTWMLAAAVGVEIALLFAATPALSALARVGGRMRLIPRIALRDAARQRARTAPAVAAVIVCVAGALVSGSYLVSGENAANSTLHFPAAEGMVGLSRGMAADGKAVDQAAKELEKSLPDMKVIPVSVSVPSAPGIGIAVGPDVDPARCERPASADVQACKVWSTPISSSFSWMAQLSETLYSGPIVDDGTMIAANGLPGAAEAADALRAGKVLVNTPLALDADGNAVLFITRTNDSGATTSETTMTVPGQVVSWQDPDYNLVLPPQLLKRLGMTTISGGYLGVPAEPLTDGQRSTVRGIAAAAGVDSSLFEMPAPDDGMMLIVAGLAIVIAAVASWIAVGLAAVDSLPDVAILSAVGASPAARRRLAGAQAAVITVIGAIAGVVGGLALAGAMTWYQSAQPMNAGMDWSLRVPWASIGLLVVALPLIAMLGAVIFTRARPIPVARRQ